MKRSLTLLKRVSVNPSSDIYYQRGNPGINSSYTSKCVSKCGYWTTCIRIIWDVYYKYRFLGLITIESKPYVIGPRKLAFLASTPGGSLVHQNLKMSLYNKHCNIYFLCILFTSLKFTFFICKLNVIHTSQDCWKDVF